ncbi:DUF2239 family protein [Alkanindiges sp. WGS2144]|uniref:DUF2239 family protein n=1 Tax=Alkanindiges sp. WGS2144 TaxID=3366808 RepID=UPI0037506CB3
MNLTTPCHVFIEQQCFFKGTAIEAGLFVNKHIMAGESRGILVFNDQTGKLLDFDFSRGKNGMIEALAANPELAAKTSLIEKQDGEPVQVARSRGRPKLGVVSKEVTLLPRHWEWLNAQPAGTSATLRRLVEQARKSGQGKTRQEQAIEAAYQVMYALGGNLAHFEEASRALFANDQEEFAGLIHDWPLDIKSYLMYLAFDQPELE